MEFGAYTEAIVPALCGGLTFCLMAIYSYITIATPEEDRVFRFGIFAMFVTGAPFLGVFSGVLFKTFGYTSKLEENSNKDSNNISLFVYSFFCFCRCLSNYCHTVHCLLYQGDQADGAKGARGN